MNTARTTLGLAAAVGLCLTFPLAVASSAGVPAPTGCVSIHPIVGTAGDDVLVGQQVRRRHRRARRGRRHHRRGRRRHHPRRERSRQHRGEQG